MSGRNFSTLSRSADRGNAGPRAAQAKEWPRGKLVLSRLPLLRFFGELSCRCDIDPAFGGKSDTLKASAQRASNDKPIRNGTFVPLSANFDIVNNKILNSLGDAWESMRGAQLSTKSFQTAAKSAKLCIWASLRPPPCHSETLILQRHRAKGRARFGLKLLWRERPFFFL
eukprot:scaffold7052_cov254-Pinguiococcus_pyrenoidosus.AAC.8